MSTRTTRRTRRAAIVESEDESVAGDTTTTKIEESEDDFNPDTTARTTRRQTRRKPAAAPAPARSTRGRKSRESAAPDTSMSDVSVADQSHAQDDSNHDLGDETNTTVIEPELPVKKTRGRPRRSVAPIEEPATDASEQSLPTPRPSEGPVEEPEEQASEASVEEPEEQATEAPVEAPAESVEIPPSAEPPTPLADITVQNGNDQRPRTSDSNTTMSSFKPVKAMDAIMEKPMDIVLKTRQMPMPVVEDTGPKPRIMITYLILNNFKSYAGRQEVGPFHSSFTSVVGPNGSGKSNVIDSLLFVFGFRASKMRQGKISALIHNSAEYPNLDHCEVAVHFQQVIDTLDGPPEIIPDSRLVVSRKAFKNNSSKYYINSKESSFTEVTGLLRDRGIDLDHKRFLILQGEVESIAQMKPKAANEHDDGLLEYLEDIIGTSKYKTPIEESAAEVETLNEVCTEKSGRVQHVEKEKNSLEDKKTKALAFIHDENELALKQSALYQIFISECHNDVAVTQEAISQTQALLDEELEKHHGSEHIIKELQKGYSKGSKAYDAQDKDVQALLKEAAKFDQERVKFDEKRKFLTDKRKKFEKTIANAEKSSAEADETIEDCTNDIASRADEISALEESVQREEAELATIRDNLKGKTQVFSDQIAAKQKSLEPWKEKINQKQSAIAVAESEMAILEEKANAGTVAMEEMEAKIASIKEGRDAKIAELDECKGDREALQNEKEQVEAELKNLAEIEPRIRAKLSTSRQKADEARSSLSQNQNRGNVLTALMRMKESGRIDGFHGRLGNLGTIDEQYDVAISTACPQLDNFVTDTVEAGQQCIEYLRKTNLGRGNFMCLDKLRARGMDAIQTPENAPRLFDLIKAKDSKFRPAFYHALQDTLVAADLAQANRIAYGARRWRVVTLDGELIDKSGTMSGGGKTVKKGAMSSKLVADTSKEQVAKAESDRDAVEQKFQEFLDHQRQMETRHKELGREIPDLETKMQKLGLEIQSAEKNLADAQRRVKELAKEHQPSETDNNRVATLQKEIAKLNKEMAKLHAETEGVEAEIKELQDKIMEVGGEKLRAQRAKVDYIKEEISSHAEETSNAEVRKAKAEKAKVKLGKDHAKATREIDAAIRDLEQLEEEIENQGSTAETLQANVEEAQESLAVMKKELATLKEELDGKTAELNESRALEIETRAQLEENQKTLVDSQKRLRYWHDKLGKLVLQNVNDLIGEAPAQPSVAQSPTPKGEDEEKKEDSDVEMEDRSEDDDADAEEQLQESAQEQEEQKAQQQQRTKRREQQPDELPRYTEDELKDLNKERLKAEIAVLEEKTQNVNVDVSVLSEYRRRVEEHAARSSDLAEAVAQRDGSKKRCDDLRRLRLEGFMEGFSTISLRLKEMYQMITMGGNAELELVDSLDPFSEGILFSVMPPKKSWKNISNLSGGEKTLSSLALVFALHHYKPTPLYVMDEIDAALDFRNVSIVANYIKERTKNAQFIVISLRNNMFELAARLVGVYKVNHMTKSVAIENRDFITRSGAPRPGHGASGVTTQMGTTQMG